MSYLSKLSLANRGLTALVALIVTGFGLLAIPSLNQQLFPSLDFPAAYVTAIYPGASPEVVERQVTEPIENALAGTPGLEQMTSTTRDGLALVLVEFEFGTDLTSAVAAMQNSLGRIQSQLPSGVTPSVLAGSTAQVPVLVLAVGSNAAEPELAEQLRTQVLPAFRAIDGVRDATLNGARDQQLVITPNPLTFASAGLDLAALPTVLATKGLALPAGSLTDGDTTLNVQVGKPFASLDEVRDIYLPAAGGPVRLGDIAFVEGQPAPPTTITRTNGTPSLGIVVYATQDGNAVSISRDVRELLPDLSAELSAALGTEVTLTPVFDQAPFISKSIEGLTTEGGLGLLMAVAVILVFLLSIRSTLVTAVSIPLSVLVALIALWGLDYSLNILTVGALTIAIGRVVDDSIVVLENIKRHLGYGGDKRQAILTAVREVAGAVTASTLTTVAVFLPVGLVSGIVGVLFSSFAITVTVALLASLVVALTIIPVLAYWFLKPASGPDAESVRAQAVERERRSWLQRAYLPVLRFAMRRRATTLLMALVIFAVTAGMGAFLKTNFFDQSEQTTLAITQTLPAGTSLVATDRQAARVEQILERTEGVENYQVNVGASGLLGVGGLGGTNAATFAVALREGASVRAVQQILREQFAALPAEAGEIRVEPGLGSGFSPSSLKVVVQAPDAATLRTASEQVRQVMAGLDGVVDVTSDLAGAAPRVEVQVDSAAAAAAGLDESAVTQVAAAALRGVPLGQITVDGRRLTVLVRLPITPTSLEALRALPIPTASGSVPLGQIAAISEMDGPVQVSRINGQRSVTVSGTATSDNIGATNRELTRRLNELRLPAGATWTMSGVGAQQDEAFSQLGLALAAAVAIVFIIMAATFGSLIQPLILLVSIPFAATGALGMLLITGTPLGVPALIGLLMLVGIVVTNAIVLLDLINQYRRAGMSVAEAVVEGGRRRLRPILMTAVATVFALLPMAFGLTGRSAFIARPLALVVIGGLVSSTLLTLVLVPALYTMVEGRAERRARRRASGAVTDGPAPDPVPVEATPA